MRIARHKDVLKKRVRRFFESPPYERRAVAQVTRELGEVAEVYVFGGLLRDLALYGGANFSSDVDIVVVPHEGAAIEAIAKKFQFKKNRFGGYRLGKCCCGACCVGIVERNVAVAGVSWTAAGEMVLRHVFR